MPCKKLKGRKAGRCTKRKKVYRKNNKRYYKNKSGKLVLLKGKKKAPFRKR